MNRQNVVTLILIVSLIIVTLVALRFRWYSTVKTTNDNDKVGSLNIITPTTSLPLKNSGDYPTIKISQPLSGQVVKSPLLVKGLAKGDWYFEAVFPVSIEDAFGQELARSQARSEGDWQTSDFVPFMATLSFDLKATTSAFLVLAKDNPSGLPARATAIKIPLMLVP